MGRWYQSIRALERREREERKGEAHHMKRMRSSAFSEEGLGMTASIDLAAR